MRYAIIFETVNIVKSVCIWDGVTPFNPGDGLFLIKLPDDSQCDAGWVYDGTNFIPPAE